MRPLATTSYRAAVFAAFIGVSLPAAAAAQALPQHLSAMAAALFSQIEPQLQAADPDDSHGWATRKAYETLRAQRIERWSTEGFPEFSALPELAAALELDAADPADQEKLSAFMAEAAEHGSEQAFRNFAESEGRELGNQAAVEQFMQPIDAALAKGWEGLEREARFDAPNGSEVLFDWTPEQNLFAIEVADPGSEYRAESLTRLAATLAPQFAADGSAVAYELAPAAEAIRALDAQDLALARGSLFGEWTDQHGNQWIIEPAAGAAEQPEEAALPEPDSVRILREIAAKQAELGALQGGGDKVFVWENSETGAREEQTRFKRLTDPWVYIGEDAPGGAEAAERRAALEAEIAALNQQLQSMVMRDSPPPLPEPDAASGVTALRVTTQRSNDGSYVTFDEAVLDQGTIRARRTLRQMNDISGLPEEVISQLVTQYSPPEWIELSLDRERNSGMWSLQGLEWRLHVTYSGDDLQVKSIHTPYSKPLTLARQGNKAP